MLRGLHVLESSVFRMIRVLSRSTQARLAQDKHIEQHTDSTRDRQSRRGANGVLLVIHLALYYKSSSGHGVP